jgi:hypothetical protein
LAPLAFELRAFVLARQVFYSWNHSASPFLCWAFVTKGLKLFARAALKPATLLISQVARITGMSHQDSAKVI